MNEINYQVQWLKDGQWVALTTTPSARHAENEARLWSDVGPTRVVVIDRPLFWWVGAPPTPTPTPTLVPTPTQAPEYPPMEDGVSVWIGQ